MNCDIALELIEEDMSINSVVGRNKSINRIAFAAAPVLLLMIPFAVGFLWYGVGAVGPTISMMPATGFAPSSGNYTAYLIAYGQFPDFQAWMAILIGAGLAWPLAYAATWILVHFGLMGASALAALLSPLGISVIIIVAIIAA